MSALSRYALEPISIVLSFTIASIVNRRRSDSHFYTRADSQETGGSGITSSYWGTSSSEKLPLTFWNLLGRFFHKFPFLIEIWYWNLTYWVYQLARAASARLIAGNQQIFERAQAHALAVLRTEQWLGIAIEQPFQHYVLTEKPWLMTILSKVYYSHITVGVIFIGYMYRYTSPPTFQRIRRTIALNNAIAFVIITVWRCYPPRLLPREYGFIDVLHSAAAGGSTENVWNNNRFQLTIAAMPSLHFGTSLYLATCLVRFSPHRIVRLLAPLWPTAMIVTIVATANHFLADAMVGAMVPALGWRFNHVLLRLLPLQDFVFGPVVRKLPKLD
ncbi:hypothetical protein TD95_005187 [Thielaviopsis punctulata]|uniref:Inositolphosphotransferase Aur1/Ipt1 domain-containing protein n=1 Tax=Thielaviopsis punctulata TaxID=72032 RepID=A0A0F4Z8U1_9PEZI|nr:hypothetical protein TD95_005187 [Thielaviopsis punctulata]